MKLNGDVRIWKGCATVIHRIEVQIWIYKIYIYDKETGLWLAEKFQARVVLKSILVSFELVIGEECKTNYEPRERSGELEWVSSLKLFEHPN